jgi:hypothetical protein
MPRPPSPSDLPQVPNDLVRHPTHEDDDAADLSEEDRDPVDGRQHDDGTLRCLDPQQSDERRLRRPKPQPEEGQYEPGPGRPGARLFPVARSQAWMRDGLQHFRCWPIFPQRRSTSSRPR